ncbi:hypothetical protein SAMN04488084_101561 [Pedobacter antarcticus]|nr:hypothetical protein SAMN04488084_101561 [Pedobacter antarcticus]
MESSLVALKGKEYVYTGPTAQPYFDFVKDALLVYNILNIS